MAKEFKFDVEAIREQFPACKLEVEGAPIAYLDGPGGTQVPQRVLDRIMQYMVEENANEGGNFKAGRLGEMLEHEARKAAADLLGCEPGAGASGELRSMDSSGNGRIQHRSCQNGYCHTAD